MRIQALSDLHIEFLAFENPKVAADLVILAGDIHTKCRGVGWANSAFDCPVLYVCGNHEFYSGHIDNTLKKMQEAAATHVHVLENGTWIWNKTRFLCATAWTDFSSTGDAAAAMKVCSDWMNDFRAIRIDTRYRRLRPADLIKRNHSTRAWLTEELAKPFDGKTVVVTHHAPLLEVVGDKHDGHITAGYANDWGELLEHVDLWIFGHTHQAVDLIIRGCRIVSNPRGYPDEETGFEAGREIVL